MAKKTKPPQSKPANGKNPAAKTAPAKAKAVKAPKAAAKPASAGKTGRTKPVKSPAAEQATDLAAAPAADLTSTATVEPTSSPAANSLEQRYASFYEAKNAVIDSLLDSIETAEQRLEVAKRATTFVELEELSSG